MIKFDQNSYLKAAILAMCFCQAGVAQIPTKIRVGDVYEVQIESKWYPGVVLAKKSELSYNVKYFDRATGSSALRDFFPPEMRKLDGKGFLPQDAGERQWNSTQGTKATATLLFSDGTNVIIRRDDFKVVGVPIDVLSEEDLRYLNEMYANRFQEKERATFSGKTTSFESLLGMSKEAFLKKLKDDQQKLLNGQTNDTTQNDDSDDDSTANKVGDTKRIQKLIASMDNLDSEEGLAAFKQQLAEVNGGVGFDGEAAFNWLLGDLLEDDQYHFSINTPTDFVRFTDREAEFTALHTFKKSTDSSPYEAVTVAIHRLDLVLQPENISQIRTLESTIGIPVDKIEATVSEVPLEIWVVGMKTAGGNRLVELTTLVPITPTSIRIVTRGPAAIQDQLLMYMKAMIGSLNVPDNRLNRAGYRSTYTLSLIHI